MKEIKDTITKSKKYIDTNLRKEFILASADDNFVKLCNKLKLKEEDLMKYTSLLQDSVSELNNCKKCTSLDKCKNKIIGHVYFPVKYKNTLDFEYKECKHHKKEVQKNNTTFFETPEKLRNANLSNLINEKERTAIIKYIKDFLKKKQNNEYVKGLYLSGNFGSGKSYILSALLNEMSNKGYSTVNIYFPRLIQTIKASFDSGNYSDILDEICMCDMLLIDDIGAENNTSFTRDEILGTILQYRMDHDLTTFFTSNLNLEELESHLSQTNKSTDIVSARRIIERIKYLADEEVLISKNKR